jgi:hypothetical protein
VQAMFSPAASDMCFCCALCRQRETWLSLLHFITSQSKAAAQSTALAMGAYHTIGLLQPIEPGTFTNHYNLCSFGRGGPFPMHSNLQV